MSPTLRRRLGPIAFAAIMGLGLPAAKAADQTLTVEALQDSSVFSGTLGSENFADGSGDYLWLAVTAEGLNRRMLIKFDLAGVPAGAVVRRVTVTLWESRARDEHEVAMHRLLASWGEAGSNAGGQGSGAAAQPGDATWINRFHPGTPWTSPGGDFDNAPSAVLQVGAPNTTYAWDSGPPPPAGAPVHRLVSDVQGWLAAPASNHGWIFVGAEAGLQNAKRFESRNNAVTSLRPRMTIVYSPADAAGSDADVPVPPWALALLAVSLWAAAVRHKGH
jgi:hypothetical protein